MKSSPILAVYLSRSLRSWRRAKNPANEGRVRCRKDLCYPAFSPLRGVASLVSTKLVCRTAEATVGVSPITKLRKQ